mgnify:CR=1 FL=1
MSLQNSADGVCPLCRGTRIVAYPGKDTEYRFVCDGCNGAPSPVNRPASALDAGHILHNRRSKEL